MDLTAWFTVDWHWYAVFAGIVILEIIYAAVLMHDPSPERRARGYAQLFDALEAVLYGVLLLAAIAFVSSTVIVGVNIVDPYAAERYWANVTERLVNYLLSLALLDRDLTMTVILAPLTGTLNSASLLTRIMAQYLLFFSVAMLFATRVAINYGSLMVSAGLGLTSTRRLRSIGPYLVFSLVAIAVASGGLAPYVHSAVQRLQFNYTSGIIDVFAEAFKQFFMGRLNDVVNDGKLLAEVAVVVSLVTALVAAVAAASSRAAGGLVDTLLSRLRGV
jgi:hypothetical protein